MTNWHIRAGKNKFRRFWYHTVIAFCYYVYHFSDSKIANRLNNYKNDWLLGKTGPFIVD